jgi:hypothetical protein
MNFHAEISELWESYRKDQLDNPCDKGIGLTCEEEELSDIIIRVLDWCAYKGIDIDKAITYKIHYNKTREYKHGGKKV